MFAMVAYIIFAILISILRQVRFSADFDETLLEFHVLCQSFAENIKNS